MGQSVHWWWLLIGVMHIMYRWLQYGYRQDKNNCKYKLGRPANEHIKRYCNFGTRSQVVRTLSRNFHTWFGAHLPRQSQEGSPPTLFFFTSYGRINHITPMDFQSVVVTGQKTNKNRRGETIFECLSWKVCAPSRVSNFQDVHNPKNSTAHLVFSVLVFWAVYCIVKFVYSCIEIQAGG